MNLSESIQDIVMKFVYDPKDPDGYSTSVCKGLAGGIAETILALPELKELTEKAEKWDSLNLELRDEDLNWNL